jgi:hypothetical protein
MRSTARQTRENRTITIDFQNEATYFQLLGDGKAFLECVLAFVLSLGFQLKHKATCSGSGYLTRHSHYVRIRLSGMIIWRLQCTTCKAVFTILPHFVLRYRSCDRRWPVRLSWLHTAASVWSSVQSFAVSPRWPCTVSSAPLVSTVS